MEKLTDPARLVGDDIDERLKCGHCKENNGINLYPIGDIDLCADCLIFKHLIINRRIDEHFFLAGKFPKLSKEEIETEKMYAEYIDNWHSEVGQ